MALRVRMAMLAALLMLPAQPLQAQNYAPFLFGYGAQRPYPGYGYPGVSPYVSPYGGRYSPYRPDRDFDDGTPFQQSGTVRTLCVRLCDGFYFPISYAAPRGSLARDADACSASCGTEARLFYHSTHGGDVESMVDLSGMAYASLPNAFKYRKTLVQGCSCRPQPWSDAEQRRHRGYGPGETAVADPRVDAPASANEAPRAPSADDQRAIERPQPVARQIEPLPERPGRFRTAPKPQFVWPGDRN